MDKTNWSRSKLFNRPGAKSGCTICGHKFTKDEQFAVGETKVSWFRGDDEVGFFCRKCVPENVAKKIKLR